MYEIGVNARFEAAHKLSGDFGLANRMHGHTYLLEVVVRGERLRNDGTLYDIRHLYSNVKHIVRDLHFRDLGEVPGLTEINTTAENVAEYCWERLASALRGQGLHSLVVRIWENPQVYAARDDLL